MLQKIVEKSKKRLRDDFHREIHGEIGLLKLEINKRFEETNKKIDTNQEVVLEKNDEIKKVENEDIIAICKDVKMLKRHCLSNK